MMIISFAWTVEVLLDGKKTVTRRCWTPGYARRFKKGDLVKAYDKSPRAGGKHVATIRLTADPYEQSVFSMNHRDLQKEGDLWNSFQEFVDMLPCQCPWVIEFEVVEIIGKKGMPKEEK